MKNPAIDSNSTPGSFASSTPVSVAKVMAVMAMTSPSSRRTGTNSNTGSSRYGPRPAARPLRSTVRRSDSRISALKAAPIVPTYDRGQRQDQQRPGGSSRGSRDATPCRLRWLTFDEPARQSSASPQPLFQPPHGAVVGLVIVAKQVQQPVQGQHAPLGGLGVSLRRRLTTRDAARDDDVTEKGYGLWLPAGLRPPTGAWSLGPLGNDNTSVGASMPR